MNAEYRGKMPLPHIIQECPAADSQARYTAKLILPLVLAELNSYRKTFTFSEYFLKNRPLMIARDTIPNEICNL